MAGPIQKSLSEVVNIASGATVAAKKLRENERQVSETSSLKAKAEEESRRALEEEAKATTLEADLIKLGAEPESAHAYVNASMLGLDTKNFGMIRKNGKIVGSYSSLADKLAKDAVTDSLSSKLINDKGFTERVMKLGGNRKGRVEALVEASTGGKKDGERK